MKVQVHKLTIGDSDDPEIIAGFVLGDWAQTEKGQWCKEHFSNLSYVCRPNMDTYGFNIIVTADIEKEPALTEFMLRWP